MQRRGLQSISSQASCSRILRRQVHYGPPEAAPARAGESAEKPAHKPRKNDKPLPPPPKSRQYLGSIGGDRRSTPRVAEASSEVVEKTREVIRAYTRAQTRPGRVDNTQVLEATIKSQAPSLLKTQFFSERLPTDLSVSIAPSRTVALAPGTFVEIRRNLVTSYGVVLAGAREGLSHKLHTLTSTGELFPHFQDDVMFAISNFMDADTVQRCQSGTSPVEENALSPDSWLTPQVLAARVKVLKELRYYEKLIEQNYHGMAMRIHRVLDDMPWANSEGWAEVQTAELAEAVGAKTTVERLCVHKYLMSHHERFIAYHTDFLASQKFWVRPRTHLEDIAAVTQMLGRGDPVLQGFYTKAKAIVEANRARQSTSESLSYEPQTDVAFTPEEQTILRFLKASVRMTRTTQKDPYIVPVATIMKKLNIYQDFDRTDQALLHKFLIELGVVAPWNDPICKDRDLLHLPSSAKIPTPPSSLGPEEFYSHDMVEHIRHDFKDLNAYVIDDVGAHELDDAVSIESIPSEPDSSWVHVHVADPTIKIHPDHVLARNARLKFTTSYDIQGSNPMIPQSIMYDGLSLGTRSKQGLPENVLTFSSKINAQGEITDYKVRPGLLRNVHVVKYDDVDATLGRHPRKVMTPFNPTLWRETPGTAMPAEHAAELRELHQVMRRLVSRRFRTGSFWFSSPEALVSMDPSPPQSPTDLSHPFIFHGFPKLDYMIESQEIEYLGARQMVAECMQSACRVASRFFRDLGVPAIRRAASAPATQGDVEDILKLRREDCMIPLVEVFKRRIEFPRGENTLKTKGHFAIGSQEGEGYVRVTSPLRRYADLVHHWQIKYALASLSEPRRPFFSESWMEVFSTEITHKEQSLRLVDRRHRRFWALKFIEQWHTNPANRVDGHNPLENMDAILIEPIDFDVRFRRARLSLYIPSIAMMATGEFMGDRMTAPTTGDIVKVKISGVKLGTSPELSVVPC